MSRSYTDIESTLTSFAASYNELKSLSNDLTTVLKGRLCIISDDELDEIAKSLMSDEDYIKSLARAVGDHDAMSALRIYADTIRRLNDSIESGKRIHEKLGERIRLSGNCPETTTAVAKRKSVYLNISIYNERMKYCIERFYSIRKNMFSRIAKMSLAITMMIPDDTNRMRAVKYAPICIDALSHCDTYKGDE